MASIENAQKLQDALDRIFPNSRNSSIVWKCLGESIKFTHINAASVADCSNRIALNDNGYICGLIQEDKGIFEIERPVIHPDVKFRKITAKTEEEAVAKLIKWFEKNAEAILAAG